MSTTRQAIQFQDWLSIQDIRLKWADSLDLKDWDALRQILCAELLVDYSMIGKPRFDSLPAEDFIQMMCAPELLGNPLIKTQHLLGGSRYEMLDNGDVLAQHQIRAAHLRYGSDNKTIEAQAHGLGIVEHWYRLVRGEWKLAGVRPKTYGVEFDLSAIFTK